MTQFHTMSNPAQRILSVHVLIIQSCFGQSEVDLSSHVVEKCLCVWGGELVFCTNPTHSVFLNHEFNQENYVRYDFLLWKFKCFSACASVPCCLHDNAFYRANKSDRPCCLFWTCELHESGLGFVFFCAQFPIEVNCVKHSWHRWCFFWLMGNLEKSPARNCSLFKTAQYSIFTVCPLLYTQHHHHTKLVLYHSFHIITDPQTDILCPLRLQMSLQLSVCERFAENLVTHLVFITRKSSS